VYKKIAAILFTTILLASCGAGRNMVSNRKESASSLQNELIDYGRKFIGKPYRYAGKGPGSFDCSGFTSFVFSKFGYKLDPSSGGQERQFPAIRRKEDLQKGDLVFFEGRRGDGIVGHVGIVTETRRDGTFRFIHASTNFGVIISSSSEPYYASRYLRGGRVLEETSDLLPVQTEDRTPKRLNKNNLFITETPDTTSLITEDNPSQTVILTPCDPDKNTPRKDNHAADTRNEQRNNPASPMNNNVILRRDPADIPEPEVMDVE